MTRRHSSYSIAKNNLQLVVSFQFMVSHSQSMTFPKASAKSRVLVMVRLDFHLESIDSTFVAFGDDCLTCHCAGKYCSDSFRLETEVKHRNRSSLVHLCQHETVSATSSSLSYPGVSHGYHSTAHGAVF